jgi:hypothetical protein
MSCNPNIAPCNCTNPSTVTVIALSNVRLDTFTLCPSCNQPLAGFIIFLYNSQIQTDCRQLCIETINVYYNTNLLQLPTGLAFITCTEPITPNIIPADLDTEAVIPCTLAPPNDLCKEISRAFFRFGLIACLTESGIIFEPISLFFTTIQNGTDSNGLTSIRANILTEHPCIGRRLLFVVEICFRNYSPTPDMFNTKEDYEVLKGLTVGTEAWEQDADIQIMRKMRLIV